MSPEDEQLAKRCRSVSQSLQTALAWVGDNRDRIGQSSVGLQRELRKNALLARSLEHAARRKMSVFGPSQWLYTLTLLIQGNIAGRIVTAADIEQNRQLGQVLAALDAK